MEGSARNELLIYLKAEFHKARLEELSDFMVAYILSSLKTNELADIDLGAAPRWTALAYIKPNRAIQEIAAELNKAIARDTGRELVKFTSLLETYAETDPLIESGFEPLLTLARGYDAKARGDEETANDNFKQLRQEYGEELDIGGIKFKIPPAVPDLELETFEFKVVTVNRRGEIIRSQTKQARFFSEDLGNNIKLEMVYIPGGKFLMGSKEAEGEKCEKPQHEVTVPEFYISKYPITQEQWKAVVKFRKVKDKLKQNPSRFPGDNRPVEQVYWHNAVEFCARLSRKTGRSYRLPSEAQWEYACRAGTITPFYFGETITDKLANYDASNTYADEPPGEYRKETTPVGIFPPNAFGLYDMHGNVWEWCLDTWHSNYEGAPVDGSAWLDNSNGNYYQVLRGGSWVGVPFYCRSAVRYSNIVIDAGVRLVSFVA